jgi:hypothetical protein
MKGQGDMLDSVTLHPQELERGADQSTNAGIVEISQRRSADKDRTRRLDRIPRIDVATRLLGNL